MTNEAIRIALMRANKPQWWLADMIGCTPETLNKKLRHELPEAEQKRLIQLIKESVTNV